MKLTVLTWWVAERIVDGTLAQDPHIFTILNGNYNHLINESAAVLRESPSLLFVSGDFAAGFFDDKPDYAGAYWTDEQLAEPLSLHRAALEAALSRRGFSGSDIVEAIGTAQTLQQAIDNIKVWMVTP